MNESQVRKIVRQEIKKHDIDHKIRCAVDKAAIKPINKLNRTKDADSRFERIENERQFLISDVGKKHFEKDLAALLKFANKYQFTPYYLKDLTKYYHDAQVNLQ